MTKLDPLTSTVDLAIKTMDAVFMRLNAAEAIKPIVPLTELWNMAPAHRLEAERAEVASYEVAPEHWGARLALMAAWHALHAARAIVSADQGSATLGAQAWHDATELARESARLSQCAVDVFADTCKAGRGGNPLSTL